MPRKKRKQELKGKTTKIKTSCGTLYITVNRDDDDTIMEVLLTLGKSGQCITSLLDGVARNMSMALQSGVDPKDMVKTLRGACCPSPFIYKEIKYSSCCDAVAQVLEKEVKKGEEAKK